MKLILTALMTTVFLSAGALLPDTCSAAGKVAAVSIYVQGDVNLLRSGSDTPEGLKLNMLLYAGDSIKTGAGAKASIITKKGAEIRINENSELTMPGKRGLRGLFGLSAGQVWSRMLHRMAKLQVRTPAAICAVRGTEADIEQRAFLTVKVYEGHVDVQNDMGKQSLFAGQLSTVAGSGSAPAAPRQMTADEMGKWQETIEVKDLAKYLKRVGLKEKDLRIRISKDGQEKGVDIKLKEKQGVK